jgi:hypothetical protein
VVGSAATSGVNTGSSPAGTTVAPLAIAGAAAGGIVAFAVVVAVAAALVFWRRTQLAARTSAVPFSPTFADPDSEAPLYAIAVPGCCETEAVVDAHVDFRL